MLAFALLMVIRHKADTSPQKKLEWQNLLSVEGVRRS